MNSLQHMDSEGNRFIRHSLWLYGCLLTAYPKRHREEYGPPMQQVFRDQCQDAWREARGWGLALLWLRVLPDLVKTSVLEHLATLHERKSMTETLAAVLRPRANPSGIFLQVFIIVFLTTVSTSVLVTCLLPDSYASTAQIKVEWQMSPTNGGGAQVTADTLNYQDQNRIQDEFQLLQSDAVLSRVITSLDLNAAWGKKYAGVARLHVTEALVLLRSRLDIRPRRGTSLIKIRAFSEDSGEASRIANAVAEAYRSYRLEQQEQPFVTSFTDARQRPFKLTTMESRMLPVEIVDRASPGLRPARPNRPLNIVLGTFGGAVLAFGVGCAAAFVTSKLRGRTRAHAPLP